VQESLDPLPEDKIPNQLFSQNRGNWRVMPILLDAHTPAVVTGSHKTKKTDFYLCASLQSLVVLRDFTTFRKNMLL
jgi:hypothetical protein